MYATQISAQHPAQSAASNRDITCSRISEREQLVAEVAYLLEQVGSAPTLGADSGKLTHFTILASQLYRANPYHNWQHAVDVTRTAAWLATRPAFATFLSPTDVFWLLIAAIVHDLDHPGLNNAWEVATHSPLAAKYHNTAVIEHHSLGLAISTMAQPEYDFARWMPEITRARGRILLPELILATDFSVHREFMSVFSAAVEAHLENRGFQDAAFVLLVLKAILKAADIGNVTKPFAAATQWARLAMKELWTQGHLEKAKGLPVGPLNDENAVSFEQAQIGFIQFVALDLFRQLARIEPEAGVLVEELQRNLAHYQSALQKGAAPVPQS